MEDRVSSRAGTWRRAAARAARAAALLTLLCAVLLGSLTLLLLRDPTSGMAERRSRLATVRPLGEAPAAAPASIRHLRLTAESGVSFDLMVRAPELAPSSPADAALAPDELGRRPLFLLLGGYRTGERAVTLIDDTEGAVVAAMGYPYEGPVDVRGLSVLAHLPAIRRAVLDTPPAIQLALDHLLARPDVDPHRVELVGVSLGAFVTPAAAALDPRVTRLWLVHGAGRPRAVIEHGLRGHIPYELPRAMVAAAAHVALAGPLLAPEKWLPRVHPRPVVIVHADEDERLPAEAVAALYRSAREPKEQILLPGAHVHPQRPDLVQAIMSAVLAHAAERGP